MLEAGNTDRFYFENATPLDSRSYKEVIENATQILQKPKEERTPEDVRILMECTRKHKFFEEILENQGYQVYYELCHHADYHSEKADKTLFEAGSNGTGFYVILSGSVEVFMAVGMKTKTELELQKVGELGPGDSFGEVALMDSDLKPRSATVICKTDSVFLVIDEKVYSRILAEDDRKKLQETVEFLKLNSMFKLWSSNALKNWGNLFKRKEMYCRNTVLYKEGDPADDIFIIKSGQVVCTKNIAIKKSEQDGSLYVDNNGQIVAVERNATTKQIEIAVFGVGELIGEEEHCTAIQNENIRKSKIDHTVKSYVNKSSSNKASSKAANIQTNSYETPKRETTMTVMSSMAEIWVIPAKVFFVKMDMNLTALQYLMDTATARKDRRMERVEDIQKNSSTYTNYLQKEPVGKRSIISSFQPTKTITMPKKFRGASKHAYNSSISLKKNDEDTTISTTLNNSPASHRNASNPKGLAKTFTAWSAIKSTPTTPVTSETSAKIRTNSISKIVEPKMMRGQSNLETQGAAMTEISVIQPTSHTRMNSLESFKPKMKARSYHKATNSTKFKVQEMLTKSDAFSQNDRMYANLLDQYSMYLPKPSSISLRVQPNQDDKKHIVKSVDLGQTIGTNFEENRHQRKRSNQTEHIACSPIPKSTEQELFELSLQFKGRKKLLTEEDKPSFRSNMHKARSYIKATSVNERFDPLSQENSPGRIVDEDKKRSRIFTLEKSQSEYSRPTTAGRYYKPNGSGEYKMSERSIEKTTVIQKTENPMLVSVRSEIIKIKDTGSKQESKHVRTKLFNYMLWQLHGNNPRQNPLLRASISSKKDLTSSESPTKSTRPTTAATFQSARILRPSTAKSSALSSIRKDAVKETSITPMTKSMEISLLQRCGSAKR